MILTLYFCFHWKILYFSSNIFNNPLVIRSILSDFCVCTLSIFFAVHFWFSYVWVKEKWMGFMILNVLRLDWT